MANLLATQDAFMQYILQSDQEQQESPFAELVDDQTGISRDVRMQIYANGYRLRLIETIETDHEVLSLYLGDDLFERMSQGFIKAHPSTFKSLRNFCDALPEYLRQDEFFQQHVILADIARFERLLLTAFDAREDQRASFSELQALDPNLWPQVSFRFHSSVQVFSCQSNAVESWQAIKNKLSPEAAEYQLQRHWLLWRGESRLTEFISLQPYQFELLTGFIQGNDFSQQCELMLGYFSQEEAAMQVLQAIQAWFELGLIQSIHY